MANIVLQTMTDKGRLLTDVTNYTQWLRSLQIAKDINKQHS